MLPFTDNAYGKTLRQYHGWVVRGVFAVSLTHVTFFFKNLLIDLFFKHAHIQTLPLTGMCVVTASSEGCAFLWWLHGSAGMPWGRWAEGRFYVRNAPWPYLLPTCHGEAAGHSGCSVWGVRAGVRWGGVRHSRTLADTDGAHSLSRHCGKHRTSTASISTLKPPTLVQPTTFSIRGQKWTFYSLWRFFRE